MDDSKADDDNAGQRADHPILEQLTRTLKQLIQHMLELFDVLRVLRSERVHRHLALACVANTKFSISARPRCDDGLANVPAVYTRRSTS